MNKLKIHRVILKRSFDESPNLDHYGKYTDEASDWAICTHCGEYVKNLAEDHAVIERGKEYRYFIPCAGGEKPGSAEYQKYGKQDFARMNAFCLGEVFCLGIIAKAEVITPSGIIQVIRSGGLWGVESDSGREYLESVEKDELDSLARELEAFGVGKRAIQHAISRAERKSE